MPTKTGDQTAQKVSFTHLDNFLKFAPIVGLAIIAYLQSLFPSKAEFEKMHATMHEIEKQIITLTTLQNKVDDHSRRLDILTTKIQALEIQIVKQNKP
tara:strand:- start:315 stop:608 length:294 start_codon:yes stop_codon:yes gene_type:complete